MTPATDRLTVTGSIAVTFKTFQNVEALRIAMFSGGKCSMTRAHTGTAEEKQYLIRCRALHQLREEVFVLRTSGIQRPLHGEVLSIGQIDLADPVTFSLSTYVDQFDPRIGA